MPLTRKNQRSRSSSSSKSQSRKNQRSRSSSSSSKSQTRKNQRSRSLSSSSKSQSRKNQRRQKSRKNQRSRSSSSSSKSRKNQRRQKSRKNQMGGSEAQWAALRRARGEVETTMYRLHISRTNLGDSFGISIGQQGKHNLFFSSDSKYKTYNGAVIHAVNDEFIYGMPYETIVAKISSVKKLTLILEIDNKDIGFPKGLSIRITLKKKGGSVSGQNDVVLDVKQKFGILLDSKQEEIEICLNKVNGRWGIQFSEKEDEILNNNSEPYYKITGEYIVTGLVDGGFKYCIDSKTLKLNDKIVSINNEKLDGKSFEDVLGLFSTSEDTLKLKIQRVNYVIKELDGPIYKDKSHDQLHVNDQILSINDETLDGKYFDEVKELLKPDLTPLTVFTAEKVSNQNDYLSLAFMVRDRRHAQMNEVTLDRADGRKLGVNLEKGDSGKGAQIQSVDEGGQAEAYSDKLTPGRTITHINDQDISDMAMKDIGGIIKSRDSTTFRLEAVGGDVDVGGQAGDRDKQEKGANVIYHDPHELASDEKKQTQTEIINYRFGLLHDTLHEPVPQFLGDGSGGLIKINDNNYNSIVSDFKRIKDAPVIYDLWKEAVANLSEDERLTKQAIQNLKERYPTSRHKVIKQGVGAEVRRLRKEESQTQSNLSYAATPTTPTTAVVNPNFKHQPLDFVQGSAVDQPLDFVQGSAVGTAVVNPGYNN